MRSRIRTSCLPLERYLSRVQKGCRQWTKTSRQPYVSLPFSLPFTLIHRIIHQNQSQHLTQSMTQSPDLRARDRELTEIAKSIGDLAELFKDLSVLVIDQGTLLDSVEYNIEQTAVYVQEAAKDLVVATRRDCLTMLSFGVCIYRNSICSYQENTGKRKCFFLLLLTIFGLVVLLIFKPRGSSIKRPPSTPSEPPTHHSASRRNRRPFR